MGIALVGALMALSGCASTSTPDGNGTKATVVMTKDGYRPQYVRIAAGNRVTFVNRDAGAVTAETEGVGVLDYDRRAQRRRGAFDVHTLRTGEAESVVFDQPGTYRYHSSYDSSMTGTIEVVPDR